MVGGKVGHKSKALKLEGFGTTRSGVDVCGGFWLFDLGYGDADSGNMGVRDICTSDICP